MPKPSRAALAAQQDASVAVDLAAKSVLKDLNQC